MMQSDVRQDLLLLVRGVVAARGRQEVGKG